MKVELLEPAPEACEPFRRDRVRLVPPKPGCYVLTTFQKDVLYLGLTVNLRRRLDEHLDNPSKTGLTAQGRAVLFHWLLASDIHVVERTWMNIHLLNEGRLPILNSVYSPVST